MTHQRTDAKVIEDFMDKEARTKALRKQLRDAGIRVPRVRHSPAFEAGARAVLLNPKSDKALRRDAAKKGRAL